MILKIEWFSKIMDKTLVIVIIKIIAKIAIMFRLSEGSTGRIRAIVMYSRQMKTKTIVAKLLMDLLTLVLCFLDLSEEPNM